MNLDRAGYEDRYTFNSKYLTLITGEAFEKIEDGFELVSKKATVVKVRNTELPIEQDINKYKARGIEIQDFDNPNNLIDFQSLVRYFNEMNPESLIATNDELRISIPNDLPLLLKIDSWHHKSYSEYGGAKPSSYETFQLIADILVAKDVKVWKRTLKPNNDWRNWPEAGGL